MSRQKTVLVHQRAELQMLLHVMEHDRGSIPARWQVESLKKTLLEIEQDMRRHPHRKG
ncbi:MAG TPA: hypothetical protein VGR15_10760 [Bacteroidota bacterium]|jgi:hypothetical protein|nr:hypothetical protein [Bacteroidota bacterium]